MILSSLQLKLLFLGVAITVTTATMSAVPRPRFGFGSKPTDPSVTEANFSSSDTAPAVAAADDIISADDGRVEPTTEQPEKDLVPTEEAQRGVQQVEAVTLTWTKSYLIAVFIL